jgi:hypothetical protein
MNTPSVEDMHAEYRAHLQSPGDWPQDFPILGPRQVQEGLTVWSRSHTIEGRTMGTRGRFITQGNVA